MKYYRLVKDLPTFKKGTIFYTNEHGSLVSTKDHIVAYVGATIAKFPNILKDWFKEVPAPERDKMTKWKFFEYLQSHEDERFFQAVRNFAREYLGDEFSFIYASKKSHENYIQHYEGFQDTFPFECDAIHELLKGDADDDLSDEEQRADEY
jgi:glycosylphosphatidylinositol transamidase (GPIT) subunit GPI8